MSCPWDIKTGKYERWIDIQIAMYWELVRNGTDEDLCFESDGHKFKLVSNGLKLPSVTQILRHEGIIPDMKFVTDYGLLRGQYVHRATQLYDQGRLDENSLDDEVRPYLDCYKQFLADYSGNIEHIEKQLWHPVYRYAGIADRISDDKNCHILFLHPKKSRPYTFEVVNNLRGNLNIGLSALNLMNWKENQ